MKLASQALTLMLWCCSIAQSPAFRGVTKPHGPRALQMVTGDERISGEASKEEKVKSFTITENSRRITLRASKTARKQVEEINRPLEEYLRLPASEYSVLDGDSIDRLDDAHFKCQVPALSLFGYQLSPIVYVAVLVEPEVPQARIVVERADLTGSPAAEALNATFTIQCENRVTMERPQPAEEDGAMMKADGDEEGTQGRLLSRFRSGSAQRTADRRARKLRPFLQSEVSLVIDARVPDESRLPVKVLERVSSVVLQGSFSLVVPRFVGLLAKDFRMWSTDGSRYFTKG